MSQSPPQIDTLDWDDWNLRHISKHQVTRDDVDEVLAGEPTYHASYKNHIAATGPTRAGRMLTVIIGESPYRARQYYVFSARPAPRSELRDYQREKGGSQP